MNEFKLFVIRQRLKFIVDMLKPDIVLRQSPGLWYGKMGIAIFLFTYAKYINNKLYHDIAINIIREVILELNKDNHLDYDSGLAGIGSGIEYLSQNGLYANDTDDVLKHIDRRICYDIMHRQQTNDSLRNGLCGLGQYLLFRLYNRYTENSESGFCINESLQHAANILINKETSIKNDVPDILSFLCKLSVFDICNAEIDQYMNRKLANFINLDFDKKMLPAWTLTFLHLASVGYLSETLASKIIDRILQIIESAETSFEIKRMYSTDWLLWSLQCKKIIASSGICIHAIDRLDALIARILTQADDLLNCEDNKMSLKGCAGAGLSMMTIAGQCSGNWLDLE
jgi:hypothetical protein